MSRRPLAPARRHPPRSVPSKRITFGAGTVHRLRERRDTICSAAQRHFPSRSRTRRAGGRHCFVRPMIWRKYLSVQAEMLSDSVLSFNTILGPRHVVARTPEITHEAWLICSEL